MNHNLSSLIIKKIKSNINTPKRKIVSLIILLAIIFLGWRIVEKSELEPHYQTSQAEKGTLTTSVSVSGTISGGNNIPITTNATGIVKEVHIKQGDVVSQGDKIAEISLNQNSQAKQISAWANYLQAQNSLNSAQAKINSLQSAAFKTNQKFMTDAVARNLSTNDPVYIEENAEWLQAEADYKNQEGVINQARSSLTSAWLSYQQISGTITAPASGNIKNLTITAGSSLDGNQNTSNGTTTSSTSQTIGNITTENEKPQATVNLSEIDVTKVDIGQKVILTLDAYPTKSFTGKVASIDTNGIVNSGVTNYPAAITFDTSGEKIYPNMGVNTRIITSIKNNVILVSSSVIQTNNGESFVRVLKQEKVEQIPVETGDSNEAQTEIVSGVNIGDIIITSISLDNNASETQGTSPFSTFGGNRNTNIIRMTR